MFISHRHDSISRGDFEFCLYAESRFWPKEDISALDDSRQYKELNNPDMILQVLDPCVFVNNEYALNKTLLIHVLENTQMERALGDDEEDALLGILTTMSQEDANGFFRNVVADMDSDLINKYAQAVVSTRYANRCSMPSASISLRDSPTVECRRKMSVAYLRIAAVVRDEAVLGRVCAGLDDLRDFVQGDDEFLGVWDSAWRQVPSAETSNALVQSIVEGMHILGLKVSRLDGARVLSTSIRDALVREVYLKDCYEITVENVMSILGSPDVYANMMIESVYSLDDRHPLRLRMQKSPGEFVRAAVEAAGNMNQPIYDSAEVVYWVVQNDDVELDLRRDYLLKRNRYDLKLQHIECRDLWDTALYRCEYSRDNVFRYLETLAPGEIDDALFRYIVSYSQSSDATAGALAHPSLAGLEELALQMARDKGCPEVEVIAMKKLFGFVVDNEETNRTIEELRCVCAEKNDYSQLAEYANNNQRDYLANIEALPYGDEPSHDEVLFVVENAGSIDYGLRLANAYSKRFPSIVTPAILGVVAIVSDLPSAQRAHILSAYCSDMGFNKLAALFNTAISQPIAPEEDDWLAAKAFEQAGLIRIHNGVASLV